MSQGSLWHTYKGCPVHIVSMHPVLRYPTSPRPRDLPRFRSRWRTRGPQVLSCLRGLCRTVCQFFSCVCGASHHDHSLMPVHAQNGVVTGGSASSRVDKDTDLCVDGRGGANHAEHVIQVRGPKELLRRVKAKPCQLALNQIRPVGHDVSQAGVARTGLPPVSSTNPRVRFDPEFTYQHYTLFDMDTDDSPGDEV